MEHYYFLRILVGLLVCVSVSECRICVCAGVHVHICGLVEVIACPALSLFPCSFEEPPLRQALSWILELVCLSARLEVSKSHSSSVFISVRARLTGAHRTQ